MLNADYSTGHCIATTAALSNVFDKTCEVVVLVTTTSSLQLLEVPPLVNDPHEFIVVILSNVNKEVYRRKTVRQKKPTSSKTNSH
jgi:hypothetical protein